MSEQLDAAGIGDESAPSVTDNPDGETAGRYEASTRDATAASGDPLGSGQADESVELDELHPEATPFPGEHGGNLGVVLDIPVTLSIEIGKARISIRELQQLSQGSVVELDRMAGEPLDVLVNGTLIAKGEVVVINEKFGVRITDVIDPVARVNTLS